MTARVGASGTSTLWGWGGNLRGTGEVRHPARGAEIDAAMSSGVAAGVIARGSGRSYGDAAINQGGITVVTDRLRDIHGFDESTGAITVSSGCTLSAILNRIVPAGWSLPVVPGTRFVTVGGAIAADIHGKNHASVGSFGEWVTSLDLRTPKGEVRVGPDEHSELFWATVGGMGLTGVIDRATLRLQPITSSWMVQCRRRTDDLADTLVALDRSASAGEHAVAWLDSTRSAAQAPGRGVVTTGRVAALDELDVARRRDPLAYREMRSPAISRPTPINLMGSIGVDIIGAARWASARRTVSDRLTRFEQFHFPLDRLVDANHLYGPRGCLQWQCVVPADRADALATIMAGLVSADLRTPLITLKRFGGSNPGPLSFPIDGWTLAVDLPAAGALAESLLRPLDELVSDIGGRLYMAKDSRMDATLVPSMYPALAGWRATRRQVDPTGVMQSGLARRLGLIEEA